MRMASERREKYEKQLVENAVLRIKKLVTTLEASSSCEHGRRSVCSTLAVHAQVIQAVRYSLHAAFFMLVN